MKRTLSIIAALMLTFTMVNYVPQGAVLAIAESSTAVTAENAEGSVTLDTTGVLTLSGNITKEQVWEYRENDNVAVITAAEGCVFPEDCSELFARSYYDPEGYAVETDAYYWKGLYSIDISKADTSQVKNMSRMFLGCSGYSNDPDRHDLDVINVHGIDTSNVENMYGMFEACGDITSLDLSSFDTSKVNSMSNMFFKCKNLSTLDLHTFDTSNVEDMYGMFSGCSSLTELILSSFDTSALEIADHMFMACSKLETVYVSDLWDIKDAQGVFMFDGCKSLVGGFGTEYDPGIDAYEHIKYARIDMEGQPGYFTAQMNTPVSGNAVTLDESTGVLTLSGNITRTELWTYMDNDKVTSIVAADDCVLPQNCVELFSAYAGNYESMPYNPDFRKIPHWRNVTSINLSKADISNVDSMDYMFKDLGDLSSEGGYELKLKTIDLPCTNTSNVISANGMFWNCTELKKLDLSCINNCKLRGMNRMFSNCKNLETINFTNVDTSNALSMELTFAGCQSLKELDLSSFDTSQVHYMYKMFLNCSSLKTIYVSDNWVLDYKKVKDHASKIFDGCTSLVGGNGTIWDPDHVEGEYARIDKEGQPGYFSIRGSKAVDPVLGDVNGDKNIDIQDAVSIVNSINGVKALTDKQIEVADTDRNGKIDISDAVAIVNHINGVKSIK